MVWKIDFGDRDWHPWFAWYPVRIGNHRVWWETIERKIENVHGYRFSRYRIRNPLGAWLEGRDLS